MLHSWEKSISRKEKTVLPLRNLRLLYYQGILERLQHLNYPISSLLSVSGRLREVKNKREFQTFIALKVVAVAYER